MTWNYRLIYSETKCEKNHGYFAIHEVFYDEKGKPKGWTAEPVDIGSDDPSEIKSILTDMLVDVHRHPILMIKISKKGVESLVDFKLNTLIENKLKPNETRGDSSRSKVSTRTKTSRPKTT